MKTNGVVHMDNIKNAFASDESVAAPKKLMMHSASNLQVPTFHTVLNVIPCQLDFLYPFFTKL